MHGTLALVWALSAISAENKAAGVRMDVSASAAAQHQTIDYSEGYEGHAYGDYNVCRSCRGHAGPLGRWCSACSPCNMPSPYHYYPDSHGYYYFRPYNFTHVPQHQAFVQSYGGDPRNPYSNVIFQDVYLQVEARHAAEEVGPPTAGPNPGDAAPPPPPPFSEASADADATRSKGNSTANAAGSGFRFITPVTRRRTAQ
jgi:hypothetical protein